MKARDIMTSTVITVSPDTPVAEIAALLFERRISAVPVLEDGRLVGVVSEADLLHRQEIGTDCIAQPGSWWLRLFSADRSIEEYIKSHARRARDIMTREVATVSPQTPLAEVATLLETGGGRLLAELRRQPWWRPGSSSLSVTAGVVRYSGTVDSPEEREAARVAAENIAGVRAVEDSRPVLRDLPSMV